LTSADAAAPSRGPGGGRTRDDYGTPYGLLADLALEFSFDFDPCPYPRPPGFDGLRVPWGRRAFVNPPYGRMVPRFLDKAIFEIRAGRCDLAVFLLFARTDTEWFHRLVLPYAELRWLRGRLSFLGAKGPAPYPSLLAILRSPLPSDSACSSRSYHA
jgi:hypothetical protein